MHADFTISRTPTLVMGMGAFRKVIQYTKQYGESAVVVTGSRSFQATSEAQWFWEALSKNQIEPIHITIDQEPTPSAIDKAVEYVINPATVVIAIGGGSVLDAGKAIAAMLTVRQPVRDFLEGVGTRNHPGSTLPLIAVPTTAGTGSEATKNAVLSEIGDEGFKRSLRHDNFVPAIAILDPNLSVNCPKEVTAASGMDAFTQLLESYLSTKSNAITEALAYKGLGLAIRSLRNAYNDGSNLEARSDMLLAAYLSGITLANAGLGLVHGFASSVGGYFPIAHGVICSSLMGPVNMLTVRELKERGLTEIIKRYSKVAELLPSIQSGSDLYKAEALVDYIQQLASEFEIPHLAKLGVSDEDHSRIVSITENKNHPIRFTSEMMLEVLALQIRQML